MQAEKLDFDRLFDAIVTSDGMTGSKRGRAPGRNSSPIPRRAPPCDDLIQAAVALFHRGEYSRCLSLLSDVNGKLQDDPLVTAFRGASRAMISGQIRAGLDCCVRALQQAFYIPDLYCALGVVLLRAGHRAKAYAAFQRGLRIDPRHPAIRARMRDMGVRRRPPIRFLRRSHPANRVLGLLRARLFPV